MDRDGMCSLDARVVFIVDASSTGVHVIPLGALKGVSWAILKKVDPGHQVEILPGPRAEL